MKASGKRPTRKRKEAMTAAGLDSRDWLVVKNQSHQLIVINRQDGKTRTIEI